MKESCIKYRESLDSIQSGQYLIPLTPSSWKSSPLASNVLPSSISLLNLWALLSRFLSFIQHTSLEGPGAQSSALSCGDRSSRPTALKIISIWWFAKFDPKSRPFFSIPDSQITDFFYISTWMFDRHLKLHMPTIYFLNSTPPDLFPPECLVAHLKASPSFSLPGHKPFELFLIRIFSHIILICFISKSCWLYSIQNPISGCFLWRLLLPQSQVPFSPSWINSFLLPLIPTFPSVFNHSHSKLKKKKNQMMLLFCSKTSCGFLFHIEQKCPNPHRGLRGTIIWPLDASWTSWPTLSFTNLSHSKFQARTPPQGLFICFFSF